ncbi:hypothetical protein ES703_119902 [subsurface metagenome]
MPRTVNKQRRQKLHSLSAMNVQCQHRLDPVRPSRSDAVCPGIEEQRYVLFRPHYFFNLCGISESSPVLRDGKELFHKPCNVDFVRRFTDVAHRWNTNLARRISTQYRPILNKSHLAAVPCRRNRRPAAGRSSANHHYIIGSHFFCCVADSSIVGSLLCQFDKIISRLEIALSQDDSIAASPPTGEVAKPKFHLSLV